MPIVAAHMLLYAPEADAVRAVLRDVLGWENVEDHPGWLIFKLPPSEIGVHPSDGSTKHEICFICDNLDATMAELRTKGIEFDGEPSDEGFGITTTMLLPGGVRVLLYEPKHKSPLDL
ncbi:MAG TPA: VOC family protein [Gaiellaceae bacterium]|jgi:catechol 2,3-dioxygenase-like lactoylglutathione lyase family enzyme